MENPNVPDERFVSEAAQLAHEANRVYCEACGDHSFKSWAETAGNIRNSARDGVRFIWDGTKTSEDSHANWLKFKEADGWHYGPVKDEIRKTHPAFLPYKDLPEQQRIKDYIFRSVVLGYKAIFY